MVKEDTEEGELEAEEESGEAINPTEINAIWLRQEQAGSLEPEYALLKVPRLPDTSPIRFTKLGSVLHRFLE